MIVAGILSSNDDALAAWTAGLKPTDEHYAVALVDRLLAAAIAAQASDVHLECRGCQVVVRWRVAGHLRGVGTVPDGEVAKIAARVKALAKLLTYRRDVPQEGVWRSEVHAREIRISCLPILDGERIALRLVTPSAPLWSLAELGLDAAHAAALTGGLRKPSGVIVLSGPSGSGKTTTAYACAREVLRASDPPRSVVSLEDPVEQVVPGMTQSQVAPAAGYTWSMGLKALMRQDCEVLLVGEIRDDETAAVVFDAALAGQLVVTTLHARSAIDALRRLVEMGITRHQLRSGLELLVNLRLAAPASHESLAANGPVPRLLCERLPALEGNFASALARLEDTEHWTAAAIDAGMVPLIQQARRWLESGYLTAWQFRRWFDASPA